jgi:RimJ/RimL family protein N-acetyltransferase
VQAAQDPAVWRWLPSRPRTAEDVAALVEAARADQDRVAFAVLADGRAVGSTSYLDIEVELGGIEIGWTWYAPSVWRSAVTPECKLLLLGHAFDDLGAERVTLKTDALNTRSRSAITRLGASYDGTLRHHRRRPDGTVRDTAFFSILAAEWPGVRDGLVTRLAAGG